MELIDLSRGESGAPESSAPDYRKELASACRHPEVVQRAGRAKYRRGQALDITDQMMIIGMAMSVLRDGSLWDDDAMSTWKTMEEAFDRLELVVHAIEEVNAAQLSVTEGKRTAGVSGGL